MSKFKMKNGKGTANADSPGSFSSLDTGTVQSLNNMAFNAGSQLEKAAFPEGGKGLTSPKPAKSFQFSGKGPSAYEYEQGEGAKRMFGKSYSDLSPDEQIHSAYDVRGFGKVRGKGGVLEQKQKFEGQFGKGSSRMFNFVDSKATNTQVKKQGFDRAIKKQKQLSADMYSGAVEAAKTMQKTGGSISTLKSKGIDMSFGYNVSSSTKPSKPTKKSTTSRSRRNKQTLLNKVGSAIGSVGKGIGSGISSVGEGIGDAASSIALGVDRLTYKKVKSRGIR
jgi:hypothetical protein